MKTCILLAAVDNYLWFHSSASCWYDHSNLGSCPPKNPAMLSKVQGLCLPSTEFAAS